MRLALFLYIIKRCIATPNYKRKDYDLAQFTFNITILLD